MRSRHKNRTHAHTQIIQKYFVKINDYNLKTIRREIRTSRD